MKEKDHFEDLHLVWMTR